jgi:hypothetical protein
MTGPEPEAGASDEEFDEVFFEQPDTAGRTISNTPRAANASERADGAERSKNLAEVMAWVLGRAAVGGAGQSRKQPRLAMIVGPILTRT